MNSESVKPGDILRTSWGYGMTLNDYCKVLENTGKTVKCVMVDAIITDDNGMGNGKSVPNINAEIREPFRLRIVKSGESIIYRGSYPFVRNSKRKGTFHKWNGEPNYYNTWD